jgi:hypothetical protein
VTRRLAVRSAGDDCDLVMTGREDVAQLRPFAYGDAVDLPAVRRGIAGCNQRRLEGRHPGLRGRADLD